MSLNRALWSSRMARAARANVTPRATVRITSIATTTRRTSTATTTLTTKSAKGSSARGRAPVCRPNRLRAFRRVEHLPDDGEGGRDGAGRVRAATATRGGPFFYPEIDAAFNGSRRFSSRTFSSFSAVIVALRATRSATRTGCHAVCHAHFDGSGRFLTCWDGRPTVVFRNDSEKLARPARLERATSWFVARRSIQLS
jgi:hypothetical protein